VRRALARRHRPQARSAEVFVPDVIEDGSFEEHALAQALRAGEQVLLG
jgi:hypothetical protein